jgi:integrase
MASIEKRGKHWCARIRLLGVDESESFLTRGQASVWATHIESDILSGKHKPKSDKSLKETFAKYANEVTPLKRGSRWELIRFNAWQHLPFIDYKLSDVTTPRLAEWRDTRLKPVKSSTVNREFNLMSAVFECARREWQWISINPVRDVRRPPQPKHRERLFTDAEVERVALRSGCQTKLKSTPRNKSLLVPFYFLWKQQCEGMRLYR